MSLKKRVIVIGGGAAGMLAAISAARLGAHVTILEKNPRVGKKILATGNGRCNFTNVNAGYSCYSSENPGFVQKALSDFTASDAISFFEELGIQHKVEEMGKVFPMSDQASSILDVLLYELNRLGVNIICDSNVVDIIPENGSFILKTKDGNKYRGDSVVLAPGGKAMPSSGSDGYGYDLALKLGHTMTDTFPALVQLMLEGDYFKRIDGVKFIGTAEIIDNNGSVIKDRGDILFTNYGVSGPPVLQISRKAGELLKSGKQATLKISILDTISKEEVTDLIDRRFKTDLNKTVEFSFVGLINKRLIPVVLLQAGISDLKRPVSGITSKERDRIAEILTDWRFNIRGTKSWPSAQVTAGGINTREIEENTMESLLVKGLYFAGEIMDVDGMCGGYNLQWAWSSGFIAGRSAAK
ncbi:MAG: NAD(P)/FAD-dependent oxidoreductase [Acetivibrionales bacterium]|jgi:predicted Rossmann fold flavoprotein